MKKVLHFMVSFGDKYFVAECSELPIVTQAKSLDDLSLNIMEATSLHLEDFDFSANDLSQNPAITLLYDLGEVQYA